MWFSPLAEAHLLIVDVECALNELRLLSQADVTAEGSNKQPNDWDSTGVHGIVCNVAPVLPMLISKEAGLF